jgi:hypothetical protein
MMLSAEQLSSDMLQCGINQSRQTASIVKEIQNIIEYPLNSRPLLSTE